jgi:hypothetical protein
MSTPAPAWQKWLGLACTALPALMLTMSAAMKLMSSPDFLKGFAAFGWPPHIAQPLGVVELTCTILYLVPRTAVLGAILLTGYLGGAVATHVRIGDVWIAPFLIGVMIWGGLFFRDARVRALIPLRG